MFFVLRPNPFQLLLARVSQAFIFKNGLSRPLFVFYFRSFQQQFLQKNCRFQRDSNSDRQNRRRARWPLDHHHGPTQVFICSVTPTSNIVHSWTRVVQLSRQFHIWKFLQTYTKRWNQTIGVARFCQIVNILEVLNNF